MSNRIYVGKTGKRYDIFRSDITPEREQFGHLYRAVIGPFRTMAGARVMARYGEANPHLGSVRDAEAMAKQYPEMGKK